MVDIYRTNQLISTSRSFLHHAHRTGSLRCIRAALWRNKVLVNAFKGDFSHLFPFLSKLAIGPTKINQMPEGPHMVNASRRTGSWIESNSTICFVLIVILGENRQVCWIAYLF
jgi:hypothetical protein